MGTTVEIRFPLGRYHATPWDAGANSGYVEWPPAPWRVMRALLAVAYARFIDVDDTVALLGRLGNPSAFESAPITTGSTRHYMPDIKHRGDDRGGTDLVIDSYVSVQQRSSLPDLRIHWDADLADHDRKLLSELVENLPYLGRSESVCEAVVAEQSAQPNSTWWRIGAVGDRVETVEVLGAEGVPTRAELEATPTSVRTKLRTVYPPGTRLLGYGRKRSEPRSFRRAEVLRSSRTSDKPITTVRFELHGSASVRMRDFLMPTDVAHSAVRKALHALGDDPEIAAVIGKDGKDPRQQGHDHLHIVPLPSEVDGLRFDGPRPISSVVLWTPRGMSREAVAQISRLGCLWTPDRITENSLPKQTLLVAGLGGVSDVAPEIVADDAGSTTWVSATPYFPVRHRKKRSVRDWIEVDLNKELGYRAATAGVEVVDVNVDDSRATVSDLVHFRRRRLREQRDSTRQGFAVTVTLSKPVAGPLLLGQLSHFGAGLFIPARS
ncbi:type I-G CRISPR-associated protein Csb2 [Gordonia polyisoprenivorans]|uniref:type I-G CRISPR-associated protein Csb2 n=1 Tax=Gordonia polyisoprenivorans TaxID=84595 RepID=UPI0030D04A49